MLFKNNPAKQRLSVKTENKICVLWLALVIPGLGKERQSDPWQSLAN